MATNPPTEVASAPSAELDAERADATAGPGVTVQRAVSVNQDYIVLGAPTAGQLKVHGDFSRPALFAQRVEAAQKLLAEAQERARSLKKPAEPQA